MASKDKKDPVDMTMEELREEFEQFNKKLENVNENIDEIMRKVEETEDPEVTIYMSGAVFARSAVMAEVHAVHYLKRCLALFRQFGGEVDIAEMKARVKEALDNETNESQSPDETKGEKKWLH